MGKKTPHFNGDYGITRGDLWMFPPFKPTADRGGLIIIGHDTDHTRGSHRLWRNDVNNPPPADLIVSVRKHGVITPIRARKLSKENDREAEVVVGRDRTKAARVVAKERADNGDAAFKIPVMVFPMEATDEEIIGAANAENTVRKNETVLDLAEHLYWQAVSAGYPANPRALNEVQASTGVSVTRQSYLFALRADPALVDAVAKGQLKGTAAVALAMLPLEKRPAELARVLKDPKEGLTALVRERVSYILARANEPERGEGDDDDVVPEADAVDVLEVDDVEIGLAEEGEADADADAEADGEGEADGDIEGSGESAKNSAYVWAEDSASTPVTTEEAQLSLSPAAKPKKAKAAPAPKPTVAVDTGPGLGISKQLAKKLVNEQADMAKPDVDETVLKVLKVVAGLAKPDTVKGLTKAMSRLDL